MKSVSLSVHPRTLMRRGGGKKLRAQSRVPAVIYGRHHPPQSLEVNLHDFEKLFHQSASENILVDLNVEGSAEAKRLALIQEVQHHPLSGEVLHVDFHEVAENERVTVLVPVEAVGEAAGVKEGGVLEHVLFKLRVRALPRDLPEVIHVDVTALLAGQSIHIGEIQAPPNSEILGDKKTTVLSVAVPITEAQETAAAEAAAAEGVGEPEVIKEKKEEEEGAEGATPAKPGEKAADKKEKGPEAKEKAPDKDKKPEKKK
jgi:large subunit ribosomal protein L25